MSGPCATRSLRLIAALLGLGVMLFAVGASVAAQDLPAPSDALKQLQQRRKIMWSV